MSPSCHNLVFLQSFKSINVTPVSNPLLSKPVQHTFTLYLVSRPRFPVWPRLSSCPKPDLFSAFPPARRRTPDPTPRSRAKRSHGPKFYYIPHDRIVEEGETVTFQCAVKGTLQWFPNSTGIVRPFGNMCKRRKSLNAPFVKPYLSSFTFDSIQASREEIGQRLSTETQILTLNSP